MIVAYFDLFAGASGDMILGALVDAGLEVEALRGALAGLAIENWELLAGKVSQKGIAATRIQVSIRDEARQRRYPDLDAIIASGKLEARVKADSRKILRRIAEVEARIHNEPLQDIQLHELGGLDTLIDIVGAVVGLRLLNVDAIFVSALPFSRGSTNSRHGTLPLPAPVVAELMLGVPIRAIDLEAELVTPTGAAILTTLAKGYGTFPLMTLERFGYGAGTRELPIPNILRVLIGRTSSENDASLELLTLIETNIDDANPQVYDYLQTKLYSAGALDLWLTPIQMKKNRPGTMLSILGRAEHADTLAQILFEEGVTLGLRQREVLRYALEREIIPVETRYGPVRVKFARARGRVVRIAPEYEDCKQRAEEQRVSFNEIYRVAEIAAREKLNE